MSADFTIVADTREQRPYLFEHSVTKALKTGDYSIVGLEERVAVERKGKADCYLSLGKGRARLKREFERLSEYDYAAMVIEASLSDFLRPPGFSQMRPSSAINTLISWSVKYGVHVFFSDTRHLARALTYRILQQCHRHLKGKK